MTRQGIRQLVGLQPAMAADDTRLLAEMRSFLNRDTVCRNMLLSIGRRHDKGFDMDRLMEIIRDSLNDENLDS